MLQMIKDLKTKILKQEPKVERRQTVKEASPPPAEGSYIVRQHHMMEITAPVPEELWKWLTKHEWRVSIRSDRRKYTMFPANTFTKFVRVAPSERAMFLRSLLRNW